MHHFFGGGIDDEYPTDQNNDAVQIEVTLDNACYVKTKQWILDVLDQ